VVTTIVGLVLGAILSQLIPATMSTPPSAQDQAQVEQADPESSGPGDDPAVPMSLTWVQDGSGPPAAIELQGSEGEGGERADPPEHEPGNGQATGTGEPGAKSAEHHEASPEIKLWMVIPFVLLLGSIALMPFISEHFWHDHFPDFAFLLGSMVVSYYLLAFDQPYHEATYGAYKMTHAWLEYYAFMALVGGLFVASGGVLVDVRGRGGPIVNTAILAFGAVIANVVGTTGASVLLIRPFLRVNEGRLRPIHVVLFIFIVSNCGGALTPIGDPPLYLGFLKGVPFQWTILHLWPMWATAIGLLLAIFVVIDLRIGPARDEDGQVRQSKERTSVRIGGVSGMIALGLIIFGVFLDTILASAGARWAEHMPVGATFQIAVAIVAYLVADKKIHESNEFNFFPVKEVGLLFIGIFATMAPALGFLASHGASLGLDSPTKFYFGTGALSGVLDNAPTYLNFLQVAFASHGLDLTPDNVHHFLATDTGRHELAAVSIGAVFFGAMTYIGNGPNFMVRAIAEASGLRMPSFFGYVVRALVLLVPVLLVTWFFFIR